MVVDVVFVAVSNFLLTRNERRIVTGFIGRATEIRDLSPTRRVRWCVVFRLTAVVCPRPRAKEDECANALHGFAATVEGFDCF